MERSVRGRLSIIESASEIKAKIIFEAAEVVDKILRSNSGVISRRINSLLSSKIYDHPTTQSILSGVLQRDFGLTNEMASSSISRVISILRDNTKIQLKKSQRSNLFYAINIKILEGGITPFMNIKYSSEGGEVNWMKWLLTEGVTVINDEFFVLSGNFSGSRSGLGIMAKGGSFRVEPEFAGTEDDNFIVNTIKQSYDDMIQIIGSYL